MRLCTTLASPQLAALLCRQRVFFRRSVFYAVNSVLHCMGNKLWNGICDTVWNEGKANYALNGSITACCIVCSCANNNYIRTV